MLQERNKMEKKEILFLSFFLIILFLGQLSIADRVIFGDDYIFATFAEKNQFFYTENAHPPLPVWTDIFLTEIFPLTNRTIRLTSIIFATLTVGLVYFITKRMTRTATSSTDISTQIAMLATIITGLSAWHIRASQMNSGSDGGMFTFFFYLTIYFFLIFLERKERKWSIATGIAFGFTMLSKETGVLLIPICGLYYWYTLWKRKKEAKENVSMKEGMINGIKNSVVIGVIALVVWSIFPILDILYNNSQSTDAILNRINDVVIERESTTDYNYWFMTVFSIFKLLIWTGPLLLFLSFLSIMKRKEWKQEECIFILLIIVSVLFYIIITPPNLDRTRYLMMTIPALAIMSAKYMTIKTEEYGFWKKEWFFVGVGSVCVFIAFLLINQNSIIVSYESQQNPMVLLKEGNINFSIPIFTETDNSGFLLHFGILVVSYVITALGGILLLTKNKTIGKTAFIIFLSISIGYNFIVAEEYGLHWTSPNYSDGIKEIIEYGQENQLKEPLYLLKNYELQWYLKEKYTGFTSTYGISETNQEKIKQLSEELETKGGTIIFSDMPPMDKNGSLWQAINNKCKKEYIVEDKDIEIGYVFTC